MVYFGPHEMLHERTILPTINSRFSVFCDGTSPVYTASFVEDRRPDG